MKMQKPVKFVKKNLKINMWKAKIIIRHHCCYTGKYRGAAHRVCNLKYSLQKKSYSFS